MNKYVTTITIIHDAESTSIAQRDARVMCDIIKEQLIGERSEPTEPTDIGVVHNVTLFGVREKR